MTKAFELSVLVDAVKARGLTVAEEAVKIFLEETVKWVEESITLTDSKFDDLLLAATPALKDLALKAISKIDGKAN